ncbi:MAG TPA: hypothetical protein P5080_00995 [Candidatus Paceibacterota bacterium]|nr:hypothetical protein [Candidatus Pacearchaeota archaeon]HRZ50549.1 hypothetical protein [Candidatus Paceibacterota bacterium]HSA36270.1 hypothetical protein [Candidatus Paceibacterota bacterium]
MENDESNEGQSVFKRYAVLIVAGMIVLILAIVLAATFLITKRSLTIVEGKDPVVLKAGDSYTIKWAAGKVDKVGIILYSPSGVQWIARNLPGKQGIYDWKTFVYQRGGNDFRIVVFEYPWKDGNLVAYSNKKIEILSSKYVSCEALSVEAEYPFIASNYENIRKVFITANNYNGNLDGFEGADKKCAKEAEKLGYQGNFIAFLGNDSVSAKERLKDPSVYVLASGSSSLVEGTTCHRLLAENTEKLIEKFTLSAETAKIKLDPEFIKNFGRVWVGRLTPNAKKDCLTIMNSEDSYSYSTTCQNWSQSKDKIYTGNVPDFAGLERCYNSQGKSIPANYVGAYSSVVSNEGATGLIGKSCNSSLRLLCVEQ